MNLWSLRDHDRLCETLTSFPEVMSCPMVGSEAGGSNGGSGTQLSKSGEAITVQIEHGPSPSVRPVEETKEGQENGPDVLESPAPVRKMSVTWWGYITGADRATPVKRSR